MSKCIHANKLHDNLWCSTACMYCTLSQEETCRHKKLPDTNVAQTNADHIRSMPDEELADLLHDYYCEGHADGLHHIYDAMPTYKEADEDA